jgi:hypothetical protein
MVGLRTVPKATQGVLLFTAIAVAIMALLVAADAGDAGRCMFYGFNWLGCILAVHEGLSGGLIGAGGALFAGWLAWTGVRDQVQSERDLATAKARGCQQALLIEMNDLFEMLAEIWRVIDLALVPNQAVEQRAHRTAVAISLLPDLPSTEQIKSLRDFTDALALEIDPTKRGQYHRIWQAIDWIYRARDEDRNGLGRQQDLFKLRILRTHLSHLERYLAGFDPETTAKFKNRIKAEVDHRGMAAHIKLIVDAVEAGEPLVRAAAPTAKPAGTQVHYHHYKG